MSVLPIEIDQTELPQTGPDDVWTAALAALLIVAGSGMIVAVEQRAKSTFVKTLLRRL